MTVFSKFTSLANAIRKDKNLSGYLTVDQMVQEYDMSASHNLKNDLQNLSKGIRRACNVSDKNSLTIDEMVDLLTKKSSIGNEPGTLLLHKDSVTSDQLLNLDRLLKHSYYINSIELRVSFDYSSSSSNTCYITLWGATADPSSYEVAINPGIGHVTKVFNVSYVPDSGNQLNISCSGFTITNLNLREIIGGSTA